MDFKPSTLRNYSMLGQRGTFGSALLDLAEVNEDIIALTADLCNTSGLDRFQKKFPNRLLNVGIAEQNMIGIAAGIAAMNKIPFATTFANFASLRTCEQIRHFMGYMQENVKLVGFGAGFAMGMFSTTHYAVEDIAALRAINNITILSPADCTEVIKATNACVKMNTPVYLRLSGIINNPIVYKEDYHFEIGKAVTLQKGYDITLIATGTMVFESLQVAKLLEELNITATVLNMHTIKPLDVDAVLKACESKMIVTIEEHSIIGGLGSAVAEILATVTKHPPQIFFGTQQEYKKAGDFNFMLEQHGLTAEIILKKIINKFKEIN